MLCLAVVAAAIAIYAGVDGGPSDPRASRMGTESVELRLPGGAPAAERAAAQRARLRVELAARSDEQRARRHARARRRARRGDDDG